MRRQIDFKIGEKEYKLRTDKALPTLIARTRGWHLDEKHFTVDEVPISGALFDFGLYFFHNARELIKRGTGPYFYLPKLESHQEARLWNDVFNLAQDYIGLPRGTIRGTVLIETITAAFEMDEVCLNLGISHSPEEILMLTSIFSQIIYELKDHIGGLNCGRWDYIFTFLKVFRLRKEFVLPNHVDVNMTVPFMDAYVRLLIETCHRRGIHAMGGMSALVPIKNDTEANEKALASVRADKLREAQAGHDGTWVAHPALASIALDVFNAHMPAANQLFRRTTNKVTRDDLLNTNVPGSITKEGVGKNIRVCLVYLESWLRGIGCSAIDNLMVSLAHYYSKPL